MKHTNNVLKALREKIVQRAKDYQKDLRIVYLATPTEAVKEIIKSK